MLKLISIAATALSLLLIPAAAQEKDSEITRYNLEVSCAPVEIIKGMLEADKLVPTFIAKGNQGMTAIFTNDTTGLWVLIIAPDADTSLLCVIDYGNRGRRS